MVVSNLADNKLNMDKINVNPRQTLKSYLRVLKLTKKPSREEFLTIAKVAGAGVLAAGFVGFVIYILMTEIPQWV